MELLSLGSAIIYYISLTTLLFTCRGLFFLY